MPWAALPRWRRVKARQEHQAAVCPSTGGLVTKSISVGINCFGSRAYCSWAILSSQWMKDVKTVCCECKRQEAGRKAALFSGHAPIGGATSLVAAPQDHHHGSSQVRGRSIASEESFAQSVALPHPVGLIQMDPRRREARPARAHHPPTASTHSGLQPLPGIFFFFFFFFHEP